MLHDPRSSPHLPRRLTAFAYVQAENAPLYRSILQVFGDAKEHFRLHLRPEEIRRALASMPFDEPPPVEEVQAALAQLCEWGNLEDHPDTSDVATVEDFYRSRRLYQLSPEGEAAERALAVYEETLRQPGELQTVALTDVRALLSELARLAAEDAPDAGKTHRALQSLQARFRDLTSRAQTFLGSLQRTIDLQGVDLDTFLAYKENLIDYLERFIGELVIATGRIGELIAEIEHAGVERLLDLAAQRDLADALDPTDADREATRREWRERWQGLTSWFRGRPGAPSQADVLRARARSAIPALLTLVADIHERRLAKSDRATDLRTLARWFAETDVDADAHRLFRAAFGLCPARHLKIDDETLDAREEHPVPPSTSWLEAAPVAISPRLRRTGRHTRPGRAKNVIDRSEAKAKLARMVQEEADRLAHAKRRLAVGRPLRLSELPRLDAPELELFLDLLGQALAHQTIMGDAVQTTSSDGSLTVRLQPTDDDALATIRTSAGLLTGRDHWITVETMEAAR